MTVTYDLINLFRSIVSVRTFIKAARFRYCMQICLLYMRNCSAKCMFMAPLLRLTLATDIRVKFLFTGLGNYGDVSLDERNSRVV